MATLDDDTREVNVYAKASGPGYPFCAALCAGQIKGYFGKYKYGLNPDVGTSEEDIWPQGGQMTILTSAEKLVAVSDDTDDVGVVGSEGSGARVIKISGLDENYQRQVEFIFLNGTSDVTSTKEFIFINDVIVTQTGAQNENDGTITLTSLTTSAVQAVIVPEANQTLQSVFAVPDGYYAIVNKLHLSSAKSDDIRFRLRASCQDSTSDGRLIMQVNFLQDVYQDQKDIDLGAGFIFKPRSIIRLTAQANSVAGTGEASGAMNILLIPEEHVYPGNNLGDYY